MPRHGTVSIRLNRRLARIVAQWLIESFEPFGALLGTSKEEQLARANAIAKQLRKAADRKRPPGLFDVALSSEHARWLAYPVPLVAIPTLPVAVRLMMRQCREAQRKRAGRPRKSVGEAFKKDRYGFRLKARRKDDEAWEAWFRGLDERGETILTATVPPPQRRRQAPAKQTSRGVTVKFGTGRQRAKNS